VTDAARYRDEGYLRRIARNQVCLALYFLRVPITTIARVYEGWRGRREGIASRGSAP
jgi:hypothetical protein